jgi:uncharacterized protein YqjF (DUF2071 family)
MSQAGTLNARKKTGRNAVASRSQIPFLTAHWRWLVVVNYEVDPSVLRSYLPCGTELDLFQDTCLASIGGFLFQRTRLFGRLAVPLHATFEEVNLRFYVTRRVDGRARRGVVFIKELVPSRSVTCVARTLFHENYERAPMRHLIAWSDPSSPQRGGEFGYQWQIAGQWSQLCAKTCGPRDNLASGSMAEFITEHYWGYSRRRDGTTCEYAVEHPRWQVWPVESCSFETDIEALYGPHFVRPLSAAPHSAIVAQGSPIVLHRGARI